MSKTILITGPIGSGKSEVRRYLSSKGYPVYDCDSRTKALYTEIPELIPRIEKEIGIKWANIKEIFSDREKLSRLENMVYSYLLADIKAWQEKGEEKGAELLFLESAIAMDKWQFAGIYDEVLLITADYELRCRRNADTPARDPLQSFDLEMVDYIIENNKTIEELHNKIDFLLCKLI